MRVHADRTRQSSLNAPSLAFMRMCRIKRRRRALNVGRKDSQHTAGIEARVERTR